MAAVLLTPSFDASTKRLSGDSMHFQLNLTIARQRTAELHRAGERARLAREVPPRRRKLLVTDPITRPSAEPRRGTTALEVDRTIGGA
jgi:hypothetical protein